MISITDVGEAMERVLSNTSDEAARVTRFLKRQSKLTPSKFVQTTVLGFLGDPQASLSQFSQVAAALGLQISPQGLDDRFTPEAAALLQEVLNAAVSEIIASDPVAIPLLQRFSAVILQDSSVINLPDALAKVWQGCGGTNDKHSAALKLQVRLDLLNGTLYGPLLENGRSHDRSSSLQKAPLPEGALGIADLGYFQLSQLNDIASQGAFFLTRLFLQTLVFDEGGQPLNLVTLLEGSPDGQIDLAVQIGATERLPARLLAVRVPPEVANQRRRRLRDEARRRGQMVSKRALTLADWTILVTNVPQELVSLKEALVLARVRWQIELLFKLWKQHGKIDEWRSQNPWRILCETYAKLTGMVIQHWLFLVGLWGYPERSLVKAAQTVRRYAPMLSSAMAGRIDITMVIDQIRCCLNAGCRLNPRKKKPNAYQLLLDPNGGLT